MTSKEEELKTNNTIWNEHYRDYPIHATLKTGISFNFVIPILLVWLQLRIHRKGICGCCCKAKGSGALYFGSSTISSNLDCPSTSVQTISSSNYEYIGETGPQDQLEKTEEKSLNIYRNEAIYTWISCSLNTAKFLCALIWNFGQFKDSKELALLWCIIYPLCTILFYVGSLLYLVYAKMKFHILFFYIILIVVVLFADISLICVGCTYLHHVTYNPVQN